jgi:hypothetical protein
MANVLNVADNQIMEIILPQVLAYAGKEGLNRGI